MKLKSIDDRQAELDALLVHPRTEYKPRSSSGGFVLNEIANFLADPKSNDVIWFLFKKYVLKK